MSILHKITNYFSQSYRELKKVTWPTKKETVNLTIIVGISIIIAMLLLTGIDWILSKIVNLVIGV
jgi:preprotein translocase subunit SecE